MTVKSLSYVDAVEFVRNVFKDQDLALLVNNPTMSNYHILYTVYQNEQSDKFDYVPSRRDVFVLTALTLTEARLKDGPGARFWIPPEKTLGMTEDQYMQVLFSWARNLR